MKDYHRNNVRFLAPSFVLIAMTIILSGCKKLVILHPQGIVGQEEATLIKLAIFLMLIVVVPVLILTVWFAIKYQAGHTKSVYTPNWEGSRKIEWFIWMIPIGIIVVLSYFTWVKTVELDPYKTVKSTKEPVQVQVISLDWKWLFIYPEYDIATVNELVVPEHTPLSFSLTSATVMTSFFIPQLGSQMYAMSGMETHLNLMAGDTGSFSGHNQEFSGTGYETMFFRTVSTTDDAFQHWIHNVKQRGSKLDLNAYQTLSIPSGNHSVTYFSGVSPGLFSRIIKAGMEGKKVSEETSETLMDSKQSTNRK